MGKLGGAVAGLVGIGAITALSRKVLTLGDRLQKVSLQTGLAVEELEILQFAASQSGVGTEALNKSMQKFSRTIGDADQGLKESVDAFDLLGISITANDGKLKDSSTLFVEVAEAIKGIEEPARRSAIASDLFGRSGGELLPLLQQGAFGIDMFADRLRKVGGIIGTDAANAISDFNDQMDLLNRAFTAKFAVMLVAILPFLTSLVDNFDAIAKAVGFAASVFLVAKLPVILGAITAGVTLLTKAVMLNPLGLLATGVAAIIVYKDEIAEVFGFADETPKKLAQVNTKLEDTADQMQKLTKLEKVREKTAAKFAKTTKKELVPNLKNLDKLVGTSAKALKSLQGREGFGGLLLEITKFFVNADLLFKDYFGYITDTTEGGLNTVFYQFEELMLRLDNVTVFAGNRIRNSFARIMSDMEQRVLNLDVRVPAILIPASAFQFETLEGAGQKLDQLVNQINSYSVSARSRSRDAAFGGTSGSKFIYDPAHSVFWADQIPAGGHIDRSNALSYDVPAVTTGSSGGSGASRGMSSPGAREAAGQGGGGGVVVNIYDGTGQQLSSYDSAIRVEIKERSNRLGMIPALNVSGV
jgi:ribosomal protein S30